MTDTKRCSTCGEEKPLSEFYRKYRQRKDGTYGVSSRCKKCEGAAQKAYAARNKGKKSARAKEYRAKNKDALSKTAKSYYEKNKERVKKKTSARQEIERASLHDNYLTTRVRESIGLIEPSKELLFLYRDLIKSKRALLGHKKLLLGRGATRREVEFLTFTDEQIEKTRYPRREGRPAGNKHSHRFKTGLPSHRTKQGLSPFTADQTPGDRQGHQRLEQHPSQ